MRESEKHSQKRKQNESADGEGLSRERSTHFKVLLRASCPRNYFFPPFSIPFFFSPYIINGPFFLYAFGLPHLRRGLYGVLRDISTSVFSSIGQL